MIKDIAVLSPLYITVFWGIVLLSNYPKNKPKFLLGIFMTVAFFLYLTHTFFFTENFRAYFHSEGVYLLTSLTVYPLYYFYVRMLTVENSFRIKNLIHFIPAVLLGLASFITGLFFTEEQRLDYVTTFVMQRDTSGMELLSAEGIKSGIFIICRILFVLQVFYYLLKGAILTQQHDLRIANYYSNTQRKSLVWVRMVTISIFVTSIASITFAIIGRNTFMLNEYLLLIPSIIFSTLLYLIGYLGNTINQIIVEPVLTQSAPSGLQLNNTEMMREKFLLLLKDDKIFKNPELLITHLSDALLVQSSDILLLINEEFKTDFSNFVNKYRISVAKKLIVNNLNNELTLDTIALESGFDSLISFTRVFKSHEGVTPQIYKEMSGQREFTL